MKKIELTQNQYARVDDADFEELNQYKWYFNNGYAVRRSGEGKIYMHRQIMGFPSKYIDHADGNRLNNQQFNLRTCTNQQNQANSRIQVNNTSGYKGVYKSWGNRWRARLATRRDGKKYSINGGTYGTPREAALAYNKIALEHFGEFARLNEV